MSTQEKEVEAPAVELKSLNPPTIPVRLNRRTQLKPLSRLNGDWLPQLKKIKTSEMSSQVRGHNASEELNMQRVVAQWFGDTSWQLGKVNKAQAGALEDLARLHLERRSLRRNMLKWRQEEARQAEQREREHEARRAEQERLSAEIEARTRQARRESRRMSRRLHESLFSQFSQNKRRNSRASVSSVDSGSAPGAPLATLTESSSEDPLAAAILPNPPVTTALPVTPEVPEAPPELPSREASHGDMVKARVLEVRRGGQPPLVRTRTKSDLGEEAEEEEKQKEKEEEKKEEPRKKSKERKKAISEALEQVSSINSPRAVRPPRRGHLLGPFPAIAEDPDFRPSPPPLPEIASSSPETSETPSLLPPPPEAKEEVKLSLVEENRRRLRQRQRLQERILQEPFVAYRKDKDSGQLRAMERPPPPPNFAEPTNKGEYRRVCLLRNEKLAFEEKRMSLENYTAHLLHEDEKRRNELLTIQARREEEERLAAERVPTPRVLGPADWMRAFVHSGAPVGEDPDDPDNIKFCRYIRKEGEQTLDPDPCAPHRKVSSWDPMF